MPSCAGMALDPGRDRVKERKRAEGADPTVVMPNRLEVNGAPSRPFPVTGVMECAIREFEGRARPRMPLNSCSRGSDWMFVAAAVSMCQQKWGVKDYRCCTKSLVADGVPSKLHLIPVYRTAHVTGEVLDRKVRLGRNS